MTTTKTKTINFKVEDTANTNKIMGQRGTLFVEAIINAIDTDEDYGIDYDGTYTMKWSACFSENEPYSISAALRNEMLDLFFNSEFDEGEAFALSEQTIHDLSYFQQYGIPYMVSHDCARIESLIALATKSIVGATITAEALDADTVDKLVLEIRTSFNAHEGNNSNDMSEAQTVVYANMLENNDTVEFEHNGLFYEVFISAESGYVVNVYSSCEKNEDGEYLEKHNVDGGLCTGSAEDTIGFML